MEKGIAFHHAGLHHAQKELIEENFKKGTIKIIACTPTLAAGLDLPAYRAIIRDLKRYGHHGLSYIPVLEYLQMSGRAGRPKFDTEGQAICVAGSDGEKNQIYEKYLLGEAEPIQSKLAVEPVLRMYILSLISANFVTTKKSLLEFFEKTFWAHQFEDMEELETKISKILMLLEQWEFIKVNDEEFTPADNLDKDTLKATFLGKRVAELYLDPLTAYHFMEGIRNSGNRKVTAFSFLQLISHTLEMRPLLRIKTKEFDQIEEQLMKLTDHLLENEPTLYDPEYDDYLNSIKTSLFFQAWIDEKDEEFILEQYNVRPGEIRAKLEIGDWLLYAIEEISRILQYQPLIKEAIKLRLRLKHGAKEELLPLLKLKEIGRIRARKLYNNNLKDIKKKKKADLSTLSFLLGKGVAEKVKKQVE